MNRSLKKEDGFVMILIIIVILVLMIVAMISLMTSQTSQKLSADFRGKTTLYYKAEEGIKKSLTYFIKNAGLGLDYSEGGFNPFTGPVTCDKNGQPFSPEGSGDIESISCDFFKKVGEDETDGRYQLKVMVVRRPDHCKNGTTLIDESTVNTSCEDVSDITDAQVYLVNSIATDKAGRQETCQAVIVRPKLATLMGTGGNVTPDIIDHPYLNPYIASMVRGRAHSPSLSSF